MEQKAVPEVKIIHKRVLTNCHLKSGNIFLKLELGDGERAKNLRQSIDPELRDGERRDILIEQLPPEQEA